MASTAASAQLRPDYRDDLDALLTKQCVSVCVAVVSEHHAGRYANQIRAAVPLRPLAHVRGAPGFDHPHLLNAERLGKHVYQRFVFLVQLDSAFLLLTWPVRERINV